MTVQSASFKCQILVDQHVVSSVRDKSLQLAESVARYHAGCLRVIGAQNVALRDVRTTKKAALCVDVGRLTEIEGILSDGQQTVIAPGVPPEGPPKRSSPNTGGAGWSGSACAN